MYQLDTKAAKAADQIGGRIDETGKYIGNITSAENITSTKGTRGVRFSFKAEDGRSADFLELWTLNASGEQLRGYKVLMAIMTCTEVKTITPTKGYIEKYDADAGKKVRTEAEIFPELTNKAIGFLLQREEYERENGSIGDKMVIYAPFEARTEFTATEKLNRATQPEMLTKMLASMKDRPLRASQKHGGAPAASHSTSDRFADFDDDIPF